MINSVGLQGPGVEAWLAHDLPALARHRRPGRGIDLGAHRRGVRGGRRAARRRSRGGRRRRGEPLLPEHRGGPRPVRPLGRGDRTTPWRPPPRCGRPRWAKLSPNVTDLVPIAEAARDGGAEAVTLVNTVLGMAIDPETGAYRLGSGARGGGLSGPAIHPIAVRAVHDVHAALPDLPIVGVGGVATRRRRRRAGPRRRRRGPGRHGHLRRPPGARPRAPGARGVGCIAPHAPIHP